MQRAHPFPRFISVSLLAVTVALGFIYSSKSSFPVAAQGGGPALTAHWKFDEGSGTTANDSTVNGSVGTLNNATRRAGRVGSGALDFNGSNSISISPSSALADVSNNFTLSFWAYPRSTHEIDSEGYLWGGVSGQRYAIGALYHDPSVGAGAGVSVGTNGVSVYEHSANYMPAMLVWQGSLTGWTHIAVVYENKQPKLYVNGTLVRTGLTSSMASVRAQTTTLGTGSYGSFDGNLDDVRIYSGALSPTDIGTLLGNQPFSGAPVSIPGTIEAENFDDGGEGVAYHDSDGINTFINDVYGTPTGPPIYRDHPVDIHGIDGNRSNGHVVGYTVAGEWLEYTVNVATSDAYKLQLMYASAVYGGTFHIELDGVNVTGSMTFASTGSWGNYVVLSKSNVSLPAGQHVLRLVMDTGGSWGYLGTVDYIGFEREQTPYGGTPIPVPGVIQVENFDNGSEGIAYHDTTATNDGGYYRAEAVDICTCGSPYGLSVGWTTNGEWLEYTVDVGSSGTYRFDVLTATVGAGSAVHIEVDGLDVTGQMVLPNTGAWGSYATTSSSPLNLTAGQHVVKLSIDAGGFLIDSISTIRLQTPYGGTPINVPGVIQVENFDNGGEGIAYHDTTATNDGGYYRAEAVDICTCGSPYGHSIGWTANGEWLEYAVNVGSSGTYRFDVLTASIGAGSALHVEVDGVDVTGQMVLPNTGAWGSYATTSSFPISLTAGQHVVKLSIDAGGFLIDSISIINLQTPYGGTPWAVPGTIEAENFDEGGEGIAYHDLTAGNAGGQYRTNTDVDIGGNTAGYNVAWAPTGEWLEYTVNVAASTTYTIEVRISNGETVTGALHIEIDGVNVTGTMVVPITGAYGNFQVISKAGVSINSGQHVVRLLSEYPGMCLVDWIRFVPPTPAAPSGLSSTAISTTQVNLSWTDNSTNETGFKVERKTGAGGSYAEIATVGANSTTYSNGSLSSNTQYYYRVRATNGNGDSGYSNEANATTFNSPPTVSITSPANNATFANDSTINIAADPQDSDGAISKVEFFQGATKLGEDTNGVDGYTFSWPNVFAGSYQLTAKATDNMGATTMSSVVNVTVTLPVITIAATDSAAAEAGSDTGTFTISRTGGTSAALAVNFSVTGTAASGDDYAAIGSSTTIPAGAASRTVTVTPVDDTAVEATETVILTLATNSSYTVGDPSSATVNISDNDTHPPTVSLTAPAAGTVVTAPGNLTLTADASDLDGEITKVAFYENEQLLGEDTTLPYSFDWSNIDAGNYNLTAVATDNANATGTSAVVSVVVNAPPVVSITSPANNAAFTGSSVTINALANDSDGITKVEFFRNGVKLGEDAASPYSFIWNNAPEGSHTVTAVATDGYGATTTSGAIQISFINFNQARLDPANRTGGSGEDPLSRNFNWSLPLVSLPGRAGLDLGLSLSYNSLATWTKSGSYIAFDEDHGFPAPGFRLGFPVIQAEFYNPQTGKNTFLMITPSGARVELRQVGSGNLYQSVDSSYLLLDKSTMTLKSPDGTQLSYAAHGGDYQCTEIKDRNGNLITIAYDASRIDKVTDTLAREVKFNYTGNDLTSITQTWTVNGQQQPTHTWATFTYADKPIQTNFDGLTVIGPQNDSTIRALTRVTLTDQSHFDFDYTSWGQVWKISSYGIADNLLNYRSYDLPLDNGSPLDDCPRFNQRRDWAANWNRNVSGVEQEAIVAYVAPVADSWTLPDGTPQSGLRAQVTQPDGVYHKIYFAGTAGTATGWQRGLPSLVETYDSAHLRQRQSVTTWTQDDPNVAYLLNPRVTETNVYDPAGNRARTRVDYASFNLADGTTCNYPQDTYEYAANASTVLRRTRVDYQMTSTYTDRRILGLPSAKYLCDGAQGEVPCTDTSGASLLSKVSFHYDETGSIQGADAPVQHDNANFGASFVAGRANLSSMKRYDVINAGQFTMSRAQYNTAGSVVKSIDAANHETEISYADAFAANGTSLDTGLPSPTLAYPTTITDPDDFTASTRYNYQFGATTWKQTPLPNVTTNQPGPQQKIEYDTFGRLQKVTNLVNNAYARYVYGPNHVETFATVNNVADEAHSLQVFDGHGRVIGKASNHPTAGANRFSGQLIIYDQMGRAIKQSNPTETTLETISLTAPLQPYNWAAAGDDAQAGWLYTQQSYDWKGRPTVTTNQDGTTKTAVYSGCGCAGGEVVTLTDEGTTINSELKRRTQKIHSDVLGRQWKTEVLNWDGTVYSTTTNTFNARDQVTLARQWAGAENGGGAYQDTTMTYDGYGRLQSKHVPEQQVDPNNPASTDHTTWNYNPDDSVQSVIDARGASATYGYNNRHLITSINYSAPSGITPTANVTFGYDAAGNRASMTDGLGSQSYNYNQLSRMTSETRTFTGMGNYTLGYDYNLAGQLTNVIDPANSSISYEHDASGRVTSVTGSPYGTGGINGTPYVEISQYASNLKYRAWGALKSLTYGNQIKLSQDFDQRLQLKHFLVDGITPPSYAPPEYETTMMSSDYQYYADGSLRSVSDNLGNLFDRAYSYDHVGGLKEAYSGSEAIDYLNGTNSGPATGPYRQSYQHDPFGNMTSRTNRFWSQSDTFTASYTNNRRQDSAFQYDASGNLTQDADLLYAFDAAGRNASIFSAAGNKTIAPLQDGDGEVVGRAETESGVTSVIRYVRSSVIGKVITELNAQGTKLKTNIYLGGQVLARQEPNWVVWQHDNPVTGSRGLSNRDGLGSVEGEFDPMGVDVGFFDPYIQPELWEPPPEGMVGLFAGSGVPSGRCMLDGMAIECRQAMHLLHIGAAEFETPTTVWEDGAWRFVKFNPDTGQHETRVFAGYQYTGVTINGRGGGHFTPIFNTTVVGGGGSMLGSLPINYSIFPVFLQNTLVGQRRGAGPRTPYVDQKVLNGCTEDYFGVTLDSFSESRRGQNGSFTGTGPSYLPNNPNGSGGTATFTVTNSVDYSNAELTQYNRRLQLPGSPHTGPVTGLTVRDRPLRNYTGNDNSPMQMLMTQIHELGHSLDFITQIGYDIPERHGGQRDLAGKKLEDCVKNRGGFRWR